MLPESDRQLILDGTVFYGTNPPREIDIAAGIPMSFQLSESGDFGNVYEWIAIENDKLWLFLRGQTHMAPPLNTWTMDDFSGLEFTFRDLARPITGVEILQPGRVTEASWLTEPRIYWDADTIAVNMVGVQYQWPENILEVPPIEDVLVLSVLFEEPEDPIDPDPDPTCLPTDTDCDGDVDMADLLAVLGDWTGSAGAGPGPGWTPAGWTGAQSPQVPEPAGCVLLVAGIAALAGRRRVSVQA